MSVDEIFELLAHDLKRYANVSLVSHLFPCYVSSQDEVRSPRFDAKIDIKSEYSLSIFGGVCDNISSFNTHDEFSCEESTIRENFYIISDSYHVDNTEVDFDCSYDKEEKAISCKSDFEFSLC